MRLSAQVLRIYLESGEGSCLAKGFQELVSGQSPLDGKGATEETKGEAAHGLSPIAKARSAMRQCSASEVAACVSRTLLELGLKPPGSSADARELYTRLLAHGLLEQAGVSVAGGAPRSAWPQETWDTIALQAAVDAVPATHAHRIVVVDEAQDFAETEWDLVKALAGTGPLWAFGDGGQSFWADRGVPKGLLGGAFQLRSRYRCAEALASFADLYRTGSEGARPVRCPDLRIVAVKGDDDAVFARLKIELTKALKDGAKPGDIAILSLVGQSKSALLNQKRNGDVSLVRADAPDAPEHVVADTFLRFKGLERPYVIVTELSSGPDRYDVRMHVALTRATLACVVVGTDVEIARDPRLAAVC